MWKSSAARRLWSGLTVGCLTVVLVSALACIMSTSATLHGQTGQPTATLQRGHLFRFDARELLPTPQGVFLAGTFNGWNNAVEPMRDEGNGFYSLRRELPDGVHFYKFVVRDSKGDVRWLNDPNDDRELREPDGNGGMNSAVFIGPDARQLPPPQPRSVRPEAIRFDIASLEDFNVVSDSQVRVSLRTQAGDVDAVNLVTSGPGGDIRRHPLYRGEKGMGFERFSGMVPVTARPMRFALEMTDGGKDFYLMPQGLTESLDLSRAFASDAKLTFATPEWAKHAVWYQVFVERFRNGDKANDPGDKPYERLIRWQSDWWKTQPGEVAGAENFYKGAGNVWQRRYGGDIQGLREKLPYLRSLGVTALYLNPVFAASSMHKYDTRDYRHIDPNFSVKEPTSAGETEDPATWQWSAGDKVFLDFVAEAHRQGFKVVLDGVFNHVGRDHPFFQDVLKHGANSKYASWFDIQKFADVHPTTEELLNKPGGMFYKSWDDGGHLPNFKKDPKTGLAPGPYEHVMHVTKRWLAPDGDPSKGIDGWRLDVANDIPHPFWIEWRKLVKTTKPDAYISGEIWSAAQPWLQGDQFDGVMNYQFAMAAQKFFVNTKAPFMTKPSELEKDLWRLAGMYPLQASLVLQNLFDSHDTDRMASMFVNSDRPYDGRNRIQDNGSDYSAAKPNPEHWQRIKQMAEFQMTFIGAPMVYYGNEAGMWSPDDPSNRQPMVWKDLEPYDDAEMKFDAGVFATYQRAIAVRQALSALRVGYFHSLLADDARGVLAFARDEAGRSVVVILNRSAQEHTLAVPIPKAAGNRLIDWMNPESTILSADVSGAAVRPTLTPRAEALTHIVNPDGRVGLTLKPWSVTILAPPEVTPR